jgi:hypothetical protein
MQMVREKAVVRICVADQSALHIIFNQYKTLRRIISGVMVYRHFLEQLATLRKRSNALAPACATVWWAYRALGTTRFFHCFFNGFTAVFIATFAAKCAGESGNNHYNLLLNFIETCCAANETRRVLLRRALFAVITS